MQASPLFAVRCGGSKTSLSATQHSVIGSGRGGGVKAADEKNPELAGLDLAHRSCEVTGVLAVAPSAKRFEPKRWTEMVSAERLRKR